MPYRSSPNCRPNTGIGAWPPLDPAEPRPAAPPPARSPAVARCTIRSPPRPERPTAILPHDARCRNRAGAGTKMTDDRLSHPGRSRRRRISIVVALLLVAAVSASAATAAPDARSRVPVPRTAPRRPGPTTGPAGRRRPTPSPSCWSTGWGPPRRRTGATCRRCLKNAGYCVFALTYGERPDFPYLGGLLPMQDSAKQLDSFVHRVLAATHAAKIDLVGHSEGTVMPQWWLKKLGGATLTKRYVALAPLYAGTNLYGVDTLIDTLRGLSPQGAGRLQRRLRPGLRLLPGVPQRLGLLQAAVLRRHHRRPRRALHGDHDPLRRAGHPVHERTAHRSATPPTSSCRRSAR